MNPEVNDFAAEVDYSKLEHFRRRWLNPPSNLYVAVDDIILVKGWAAVTATNINVSLRMLQPDGSIQTVFQPVNIAANGTTPTLFLLRNLEGFLLSASVAAPGVFRGTLFVSLLVQRGVGSGDATLGQVFLQGYPDNFSTLGYPQQPPAAALDGRGAMQFQNPANPGAGAEFSITVPAGIHWILRSFSILFTASVAVASRIPTLIYDDGAGHIAAQAVAFQSIAASGVVQLTWAPGLVSVGIATAQQTGFPSELRMAPGTRLRTLTSAIQAADQYSSPVLYTEGFLSN